MSKYTRSWTESVRMVAERREKGVRQLVDPKKEVMVVKNNKVVVINKSDEKSYLSKGWSLAEQSKDDFKPHMMYDPKTGKGYKANTYDDHIRMDKMGYVHDKPEVKEVLDDKDEKKVKEIIGKLKGASKAHAGQAKDLQKAVDEDNTNDKSDDGEVWTKSNPKR